MTCRVEADFFNVCEDGYELNPPVLFSLLLNT